jgi:glycyl-tRNA synthetase beta chain
MGRYYALDEKLPAPVAQAIADHYSPQGPGDRCPSAPVSVAVALADKIDTLVGFFGIEEIPTGSKDPFALRRCALGVIRLIVENKLRFKLVDVLNVQWKEIHRTTQSNKLWDIADAADAAKKAGVRLNPDGQFIEGKIEYDQWHQARLIAKPLAPLMEFFADRLKVTLKEKGVRHDLITAVFALGGQDDIVDLLARVAALDSFLRTDDGANLLVAYRRAANILRIEEKKDGKRYDGAPDAALLQVAEEKILVERLNAVKAEADKAIAAERYPAAMSALAGLRKPVDAFFDKVTVNAPEANLRANRLKLLGRIQATMDQVAIFGKIEG